MHDSAKETKAFNVNNENNYVHFEKEFKYLGTSINYILDDTVDIKH